MRDLFNEDAEAADRLLSEVVPPAGRADISINQRLALAQAHATLAAVAELRLANQLEALRLGRSGLDELDEASVKLPASLARVRRENALRRSIRVGLGIEEVPRG